jgi:hypothetical protein
LYFIAYHEYCQGKGCKTSANKVGSTTGDESIEESGGSNLEDEEEEDSDVEIQTVRDLKGGVSVKLITC